MRLLHASSWWRLSTLSLFWCFCADIKNYILSFCTSNQIICPVILGPSSRFQMSTFPWYTADERWWGSKFAHICSTSLNCDLFIHWFTSLCSILTSVSRLTHQTIGAGEELSSDFILSHSRPLYSRTNKMQTGSWISMFSLFVVQMINVAALPNQQQGKYHIPSVFCW